MPETDYIKQFLDSNTREIASNIRALKSIKTIEEGQPFLKKVLEKVDYVRSVLNRAGVFKVPINTFFNELYLIDHLPINEVNDLLKRYDYRNLMEKTFEKSFRTINKGKLPDGDDRVLLDFLIYNGLISKHEMEIYEFYIKHTLLNEKPQIDLKTLRSVITRYTKNLMKEYIEDPKVYIKKEDNMGNKLGYFEKDTIYLNDDGVKKLQKYGEYRIFYSMFHELKHAEQYRDVHINKDSDERCMTIIKEEILAHLIPHYDEYNHFIRYDEVEAIVSSRKKLIEFFEHLGIEFRKNEEFSDKNIKLFEDLLNNRIRIIAPNEHDDIDNIFDNVIIYHPEYLDIYEQLNKDYKIDLGDLVIRRDDFTGGQR